MKLKETHKYDDIIHLPHPVSERHPGMPLYDRAAQFSPFSALTGYEDVIEESGRLTDDSTELTESSQSHINEKLNILAENLAICPMVTVTYFEPDSRKSGGSYVTITGHVKRIDSYEQVLRFADGVEIPMEAIKSLQCHLFDQRWEGQK